MQPNEEKHQIVFVLHTEGYMLNQLFTAAMQESELEKLKVHVSAMGGSVRSATRDEMALGFDNSQVYVLSVSRFTRHEIDSKGSSEWLTSVLDAQ